MAIPNHVVDSAGTNGHLFTLEQPEQIELDEFLETGERLD